MHIDLTGKTALVTESTDGIGYAVDGLRQPLFRRQPYGGPISLQSLLSAAGG
ncbi:hypothetical protein FHT80_001131 [Rhizobium sp. BK226]|nr:hypothetical protein [Rhizobium sp. BK226]MBB4218792.1 hypothetical protein [Rhizobium sp. BK212]